MEPSVTAQTFYPQGWLWLRHRLWPHGFPGGASGKEPACQCRDCEKRGFNPWVEKMPWRRTWQPTPVFLPGESHGQRSLEVYSHRVAQSWTWWKWLSTHAQTPGSPFWGWIWSGKVKKKNVYKTIFSMKCVSTGFRGNMAMKYLW